MVIRRQLALREAKLVESKGGAWRRLGACAKAAVDQTKPGKAGFADRGKSLLRENRSSQEADYDPRCDRYHSGKRVTHNGRNGIEDSGDVIGNSILCYGKSERRVQINEFFKILDGRISEGR